MSPSRRRAPQVQAQVRRAPKRADGGPPSPKRDTLTSCLLSLSDRGKPRVVDQSPQMAVDDGRSLTGDFRIVKMLQAKNARKPGRYFVGSAGFARPIEPPFGTPP